MFVTRHSPNGRSYTYQAGYGLAWWIAKLFALACVPMLLGNLSIHKSWSDNLALLAWATPGLIVGFIWGRGLWRILTDLGITARGYWRKLWQPKSLTGNVVPFKRGGR